MSLHTARPHADRLLLVDPDPQARRWAAARLREHGHAVHDTDDADAIEHAQRDGFALVLMDPAARAGRGTRHGHDAWQRLRGLRDRSARLPVIVMQPGADTADRTVALELGADAVVDKPLDPLELHARVQSLLRRQRDHSTPVCFGDWRLDLAQHCLRSPDGLEVALSPAELRLLRSFLAYPRHTLTRAQLLDLARGVGVEQLDRSIDGLVSRLRHKLGDDAHSPRLIRTVRGVGYLFDALGA